MNYTDSYTPGPSTDYRRELEKVSEGLTFLIHCSIRERANAPSLSRHVMLSSYCSLTILYVCVCSPSPLSRSPLFRPLTQIYGKEVGRGSTRKAAMSTTTTTAKIRESRKLQVTYPLHIVPQFVNGPVKATMKGGKYPYAVKGSGKKVKR